MRIAGQKPTAVTSCVLYDPKDGRIHHVHSHVAYGKSTPLMEVALEARCRLLAQKAGVRADLLSALHVDSAELTHGRLYVHLPSMKIAKHYRYIP